MLQHGSELFGNRNRTAVLIAIRLLEETYPRELAVLLDVRVYSVQTIIAQLEEDGVVATRHLGRTRRVSLNPRYFARDELATLLWKLGEHDLELQKALAERRRRPRRTGKAAA